MKIFTRKVASDICDDVISEVTLTWKLSKVSKNLFFIGVLQFQKSYPNTESL